jgi:hypothetical protein
MYVGEHDPLAEETDTRYLEKLLGPETVIEYTLINNFDHSSFNLYKKEQ